MSEGKALTSVIGISAGTTIIAKLAGERDDARFRAALDDPSLVRDAIRQETEVEHDAAVSEAETPALERARLAARPEHAI